MQLNIDNNSVYGVALNFQSYFENLTETFTKEPYLGLPRSPVCFIKTPNTYNYDNTIYDYQVEKLQVGVNIAVLIKEDLYRVDLKNALEYVEGITLVNDYSLPIESYYRPPIIENCRDGFLSLATKVIPLEAIKDLDNLGFSLSVNDIKVTSENTKNWLRPIPELLVELSHFMKLKKGDLLLTGAPFTPVYVKAGDTVHSSLDNVLQLNDTIVKGRP